MNKSRTILPKRPNPAWRGFLMMHSRNLLLALLPPLFWGVGFTISKPAAAHFQPLFMMLIVYVVIAAIMLVTHREMPRTAWPKMMVISAFSVTIQGALMFSPLPMSKRRRRTSCCRHRCRSRSCWAGSSSGGARCPQDHRHGGCAHGGCHRHRPAPGAAAATARSRHHPRRRHLGTWQVLARLWSQDSGLMVLKGNALCGVPQLLLATLVLERGNGNRS